MVRKTNRVVGRGAGTISIGVIVIAFLVVMGIQINNLKKKDDAYAAKQKELKEQYVEETEREKELDDLEDYMKTNDYIEDTAQGKLGLVYDTELIFMEGEE